jgi:hypothetical protein
VRTCISDLADGLWRLQDNSSSSSSSSSGQTGFGVSRPVPLVGLAEGRGQWQPQELQRLAGVRAYTTSFLQVRVLVVFNCSDGCQLVPSQPHVLQPVNLHTNVAACECAASHEQHAGTHTGCDGMLCGAYSAWLLYMRPCHAVTAGAGCRLAAFCGRRALTAPTTDSMWTTSAFGEQALALT